MAFPTITQFNVKANDSVMGAQALMDTSTTQAHPLGSIMEGRDVGTLGYGPCACIYLKGVASTAAGDAVVYDTKAATTTRTVAASVGPIAIALSANVALQYGWYVIRGTVPVSTTAAGTGAANSWLKLSATDGRLTVSGTTAIKVDGAVCRAAQDTPTSGFTQVHVTWPCVNGNT